MLADPRLYTFSHQIFIYILVARGQASACPLALIYSGKQEILR